VATSELLILGAIAGLTIYLGLPIGRVRNPSMPLRAFLNAVAIGILLFLLWDVLSNGIAPVTDALRIAANHGGSWLRFAEYAGVFVAGLTLGLVSLVYYDRWLARRAQPPHIGPGAAVAVAVRPGLVARLSDAQRLSFFIALGIGFHNLSEGLAIGQSAARGEISLALLLIIGFGLHNATEGFGIIGPMTAAGELPSWGFLALMGLIGGGPTFLGTVIGDSFQSDVLFLGFLALAAGSILYVVIELLGVARKLGYKELMTWGILFGLIAGFATDMILTVAGA
jgi:zinc transporter, ZIP family